MVVGCVSGGEEVFLSYAAVVRTDTSHYELFVNTPQSKDS